MATDITMPKADAPPNGDFPVLPDPSELIDSDGEPMDTEWHRRAMMVLLDSVEYHLKGREDYYVGGNMFLYFSLARARNRDFRGPDFFFVNGVSRRPMRRYWAVWDENGRYPDVIIELLSQSTATEDLTTKKDIYEQTFRTPEYFCYDPDGQVLKGWRLESRLYRPIPPEPDGRLHSEVLDLWIGPWLGEVSGYEEVWLRFFDREGRLVPTGAGELHLQRVEAEKQRADQAEAELARLRLALEEARRSGAGNET